MTDPLFIPRGLVDDPPYRHCRHCPDDCRQIHYDPCPDCQENRP